MNTPYFLDTCVLLDSVCCQYKTHYEKCKAIVNRNDFRIVSNTYWELEEIRKRRGMIYRSGLKQFERFKIFKEIQKTDFIAFFESLRLSKNDQRHIEYLWELIKGSKSIEDAELIFRREMAKIQVGIDNLLSKINSNSQIKTEVRLSKETEREKEKVLRKMVKDKIVMKKSEITSDLDMIFEIVQWLSDQEVIGILLSSDHPHILRNKDFLQKEIFKRLGVTLDIQTISQFSKAIRVK